VRETHPLLSLTPLGRWPNRSTQHPAMDTHAGWRAFPGARGAIGNGEGKPTHEEELHLGGHHGEHALGEERAWQQGICRALGVVLGRDHAFCWCGSKSAISREAALGAALSIELVQVGDNDGPVPVLPFDLARAHRTRRCSAQDIARPFNMSFPSVLPTSVQYPSWRRKTLPVICSTGRVGGLITVTMVLSGSLLEYRIRPDRPVGFGRYRSPCQCSRHQDLLGAAGPSHAGHCRVVSIA
jgi:hypothetical protein